METEPNALDIISPERLVSLIDQEIRQPRPDWSKFAAARILNVLFPNLSAAAWFLRLKTPDEFLEGLKDQDVGWLTGRGARALAEMKQIGLENFPFLSRLPWLMNMQFKEGEIKPTGGTGIDELMVAMLQDKLKEPVENQIRFWSSFASGFERKIKIRGQDGRALVVYVFLAVSWRECQACTKIKELYELVFSRIPKPECPPSEDAIEFEERHLKWFEKICQRGLKLSFRQRGRPQALT